MKINVKVTSKFLINGKEYHSVEEMPDEVRKIFDKVMASRAGSGQRTHSLVTRSKIIFNGTEYDNIDSMPQGDRQLYEKMLKAAEGTIASSGVHISGGGVGILEKPDKAATARPIEIRNPTKAESFLSPRMLLMGAGLLALIFLLYLLFQNR